EYRNRTGVHGFAKLPIILKILGKMFRRTAESRRTNNECLDTFLAHIDVTTRQQPASKNVGFASKKQSVIWTGMSLNAANN
ncbi:MAG: hypothetical protein OXQ92_04200, partial [Boseongicola sp.]|nr:hypothetical protein [Boseongicola sp.]